ncbi:pectate lyase [Segatella copri]|uniref:Pectate lyase n=1 Tax=Segatella copri DSM 18205 TaxID=537011 RepID=D1PCG0_9BACT|nr:pectate lyase [Segatella copri]EFB35612.1 pectate lyase [Segatella copri DSM 18205]MCW4097303.1 pectate lyase [Segatella copri]MQP19676.1 pectate lyase [Segatella copri DSM 18205]UEA43209.1 pectate lyase [Segatella copri DSM 18205]UWP52178.1 pectate lyase [Segatella copri DSM 18205]
MKKMVFTLALLLMSLSAALAQTSTFKITHAVARNSKVNQMYVTTKSGDVKYYNTADLTSVKFEGDKAIITPKSGSENDEYNASVQAIRFAKKADQGESGDIDNPAGVIQITEAKGWQESAYLKWAPFEGASSYNVYVDDKKIDAQLVRQYKSYYRADVLGLKEGTYSVKVVPVNADGKEIAGANTASNLVVKSYNREGFAHFKYDGVGAYNNDGTLKAGAKVLYITAKTAKTVSTTVNTGKLETITGLQSIIDAYSKGKDTTPIAFRIIGKVNLSDLDHISSSAEGLQIKGAMMNMTFEGVGDDATVYGFGFLLREAESVEFRNFAIMRCLDDAMSLDTNNSHVWIHNMDLFYGKKGSAADQAKGDGTVDIKGDSKYVTVAYNRFWDNGKASMCGMKSETGENWITYHHNWFDHSDSRMARVRTMSVHMYNNYYQHCDVYGIGATSGSSIFMESNYFDAVKRPIMSSLQGTDAKGDGTFSGEKGGLIKAYGNVFTNKPANFSYIPYAENNTSFDAYEVSHPSEQVPASVKTLVGGTSYDNFDTNPSLMYAYAADKAEDVPSIVEGFYGAGRLNHGDIDFVIPDETVVTNGHQQPWPALASILDAYTSGVVKVFGESNASGEGGSAEGGSTGGSGEGGSTGGTEGGSIITPIEGTVLVTFTDSKPSSSIVTVSGNYATNKGTATIDGTSYSTCVKMESATNISVTVDKKVTMTLYFSSADTKTNAKIDGKKPAEVNAVIDSTAKTMTVTLDAGSHTITKQDTCNLFGIKLVPVTE